MSINPKVSMIAAVADNNVIGNNNDLPWRIKSDLQYFREVTKHKPCIMGRKTFESLPNGPFKNRTNIVITRDENYFHAGIIATTSIEKALEIAHRVAKQSDAAEVMVIGGAEIYKLALPHANRLYLTEVHLEPEGDISFPEFDKDEWEETKREDHTAQEGESADYTVTVLERKVAVLPA